MNILMSIYKVNSKVMISKIIMINSSMNRSNRLKISLPKISEFISSFVKADPMEANSTS